MTFVGILLSASVFAAEVPDAADIMHRVAENQQKSQTARAAWVFDQNIFVRLQRPGGKLAREETRRYSVAPSETGASTDIDGALVDSFAREVMWKNRLGP